MIGTRWIFRVLALVVVCALPGLAFAAEVSIPAKPMTKSGQSLAPSATTGQMPGAPNQKVNTVAPKLQLNQVASQVSPELAKTVKNLTDQVASLKKEVDQLKKSGQTQPPQPQPLQQQRPQPNRHLR